MERKITIEEHVLYKEDYQKKMLKANSPEGFLHVGGRGVNGSSYYDYDVSGKISMQAMYTRAKLKAEDIRQFMYQFGNVLKETGKYLLDIHCILLEPEYIFYEEGQFFFCYYPPATQDLWEKFHVLTEYMVKVADYEEEECVRLAFLLHKGTMEENYSLEKLIAECGEREEKDMEKPVRKTMIDELMEELRMAGVTDLATVKYAVLETTGRISVLPYAGECPPTGKDLGLKRQEKGLPLIIISDGHILTHNLTARNLSQGWLEDQLYRAAQFGGMCFQDPGCYKQPGCMTIMPASMHNTRGLGGVGAGVFLW